jgi:hypothetical protein
MESAGGAAAAGEATTWKASSAPRNVGGNAEAPVIMIGEKVADLMLGMEIS